MGCSYSCKRSSKIKKTKIIHLNGYIEELDYPVVVNQITGKPAQYFVFTQAQLLSPASTSLKCDDVLEPGRAYFLLPYSLFQSNVSPMDLAPIARKLASIARKNRRAHGSIKKQHSPCGFGGTSPVRTSSSSSPNRGSLVGSAGGVKRELGMDEISNSRSWKPMLETILERSFNRRNESAELVFGDTF